MATIVTRAGKGAPLTHDEVDANFDNLNSDKYEAGDSPSFSNITISDKIIHSGDTNTSIRFPAADTFTVETAGSERMRIDSSGNVGIGTSSPSERVEIYGASPYILLNNTEESSTGIKFADAQATEQTAEISARVTGTTAADVDLQFIIGGNDRMSVYGDGDVKIFGNNTTTDTRKFTVESEGYAVVTINGDVSNTTGEPGGSALQLNIDAGDPNAVVSAVNSDNDSGYGTTYTGTAANSMLVGTVANNPLHFGTNGVVRATIDSSGNLLVGTTTSPSGSGQIVANGGVYLGGTGAANLLDDYEEGTWTPVGSSGLGNLSIQRAQYTKIGRQVHLFAQFSSDNTDDVALDASVEISGLPFAPESGNTRGLGGILQFYGSHGQNKNALADTIISSANLNCEIIVVRGSFTYADCVSITVNVTYNTTA